MREFIKRQRTPVYPVKGGFLGEIRGRDGYAVCPTMKSHKKAQSSQISCAFLWPYRIRTRAAARTESGGRFRPQSCWFVLQVVVNPKSSPHGPLAHPLGSQTKPTRGC